MNQDTPAINIKSKDLAENCLALAHCLNKIPPSSVRTILDIRYGLGGWAKLALERFPSAQLTGYEWDEETAKRSWKNDRVELKVCRWEGGQRKRAWDLALADFNVLTCLNRKLLDELLASTHRKYLIFTDVACCKLHLNYRSYKLSSPDLEAYWRHFQVPEFDLVTFGRHHWAASTALYKRKPRLVRSGSRG